jgi:hypothetical protein
MRFPYSEYDMMAYGLHFAVGAIVFAIAIRFVHPFAASLVVVVLALIKEAYDYFVNVHDVDYIDIVATILGALAVLLIIQLGTILNGS